MQDTTERWLPVAAFAGPCLDGQQGCHRNGNLLDNRLANLRWDTPSSNAFDRVAHGTHWATARERCPRGHDLASPNLEPSNMRNSHRACYACVLTHMWGRHLGYRRTDADWLDEADRRYLEILHFGHPLNYRLAANKKLGERRWRPARHSD